MNVNATITEGYPGVAFDIPPADFSVSNWLDLLDEMRGCAPTQRLPRHVDVCAGRWVAGSQPVTPDARFTTFEARFG